MLVVFLSLILSVHARFESNLSFSIGVIQSKHYYSDGSCELLLENIWTDYWAGDSFWTGQSEDRKNCKQLSVGDTIILIKDFSNSSYNPNLMFKKLF